MKQNIPEGARAPTLPEALISLVSLMVGISTSILILRARRAYPHAARVVHG